ncbi:MAG: hypothetical protein R2873_19280 [Caldilineaceae bacterium]
MLQMWLIGIAVGPVIGGVIGDAIGFRRFLDHGGVAGAVYRGRHLRRRRRIHACAPWQGGNMFGGYWDLKAPDMAGLYSAGFLNSLGRSAIILVAALRGAVDALRSPRRPRRAS